MISPTATQDQVREMLWQAWQRNLDIAERPADTRFIEPIQRLIETSRVCMREADWDAVTQHNFFTTLLFHIRRERKHTSASQFVKFLQIETEF